MSAGVKEMAVRCVLFPRSVSLSHSSASSRRLLAPSLVAGRLHTRGRSSAATDPAEFLYTEPGLKAKIIDGKKIAAAVKAEVKAEVSVDCVTSSRLLLAGNVCCVSNYSIIGNHTSAKIWGCVCVCVKERKRECVCVCICVKERER